MGVKTLGVGAAHACARFDDLSLRCWGADDSGQLGAAPASLVPPTREVQLQSVSVGAGHACGVDGDGRAVCWGSNRYGQLGDGSYEHRDAPVAVALPEGTEVTAVSVGRAHSCALDAAGAVWCWGRNDRGQLGHGSAGKLALPPLEPPMESAGGSAAPRPSAVGDVSELHLTGPASCVRTATAPALRCWGVPSYQPPSEKEERKTRRAIEKSSSSKPGRVEALAGVEMISLGADFGCALGGGSISCWGANRRGQLGAEPKTDRFTAAAVPSLGQARDLAAGEEFACGLLGSGELWCWGANDHGQLGRAGPDGAPAKVDGLDGLEEAHAGARFACGFGPTTGVRCWGEGQAGQLGTGDNTDSPVPRPVVW
jgi:alpha-tubulin suppressor-like RCC1 family protein